MTGSIEGLRSRTSYAPGVVATLRSLVPNRPLSFAEACRVAELQANWLLKLTDSQGGPVNEAIIAELPRVAVTREGNLTSSGRTTWSRGMWRVRINGGEPITRQRFTLAHEFKHILDAASEEVIYRHLPEGLGRKRHIEAVCDHFAACLLMPKTWVKKTWGEGVQELGALAWRFEVSQQAMLIRLQNIGLIEPLPRCVSWQHVGSVAVRGSRQGRHRRLVLSRKLRSWKPQHRMYQRSPSGPLGVTV